MKHGVVLKRPSIQIAIRLVWSDLLRLELRGLRLTKLFSLVLVMILAIVWKVSDTVGLKE
jgi:hypothetical protein